MIRRRGPREAVSGFGLQARDSSPGRAVVVGLRAPSWSPEPEARSFVLTDYEQPEVVPQLTHLWQLPLGIMIDPHSGQVGASLRAMKL